MNYGHLSSIKHFRTPNYVLLRAHKQYIVNILYPLAPILFFFFLYKSSLLNTSTY